MIVVIQYSSNQIMMIIPIKFTNCITVKLSLNSESRNGRRRQVRAREHRWPQVITNVAWLQCFSLPKGTTPNSIDELMVLKPY